MGNLGHSYKIKSRFSLFSILFKGKTHRLHLIENYTILGSHNLLKASSK